MTNGSLMKVKSITECSLGAVCNTFYLNLAIIGLENQFLVFLRVALLLYINCLILLNPFKPNILLMGYWQSAEPDQTPRRLIRF